MEEYNEFVQRVIECDTPPLDQILRARQQFVEECDDNVLKDQLIQCLGPLIDSVTEEQVNWWGLIMCSLFEIHNAAKELEIC